MLQLVRRNRHPNARVGWVQFAFFALFPAALTVGIALDYTYYGRAFGDFHVDTDRDQAISAARQFLLTQGLDTSHWTAYCSTFPDTDLYRYLKSKPKADREGLDDLILISPVRVMFRAPGGGRRAETTLSFENQVAGFDLRYADLDAPAVDRGDGETMRVAESVLASDPRLQSVFASAHPEVSAMDRTEMGATNKYTWRASPPRLPEIEAEFSVAIRNGRVLSRSFKAILDPEYARRLQRGKSRLQVFGIVWGLFAFVAAIYSIASYVRRALQKEVSHSRTLLMALLCSGLVCIVVFASRDDSVLQSDSLGVVYASLVLLAIGAGLLLGIGYGSGEGDVREAYPGKLTSLDALVLGKVFSGNVGGSVVAGAVFAGWLILAQALLLHPFPTDVSSQSLNILKSPFARMQWLWFVVSQPTLVLILAVLGLMQPIAFVSRVFSNRSRWRRVVLLALVTFAGSGLAVGFGSAAAIAVATLTIAAGLLVPFFFYDLLSAIVCLTALESTEALIRAMLLFPGWGRFTFSMAAFAFVTLAIAAWAWRRGRVYKEEEVRPEYARHIAERQSLEAEVAAAREAQLRLLPQCAPTIPGLSIFASCLPARVVGGDFYDFYALGPGRIGVFVAEGGNLSFASALSLALAKGYLMHTTRGDYSPAEVIRRLEATLGSILEEGVARATIAYAVVDVQQGTIEYARTGDYPKVIVSRPGGHSGQTECAICEPDENHPYPVHAGSADLRAGDSIVLYTDGIARRMQQHLPAVEEDWMHRLCQEHHDAPGMCRELFESIGANAAKSQGELEDDLTAVVIRCTRTGVAFMEGVA